MSADRLLNSVAALVLTYNEEANIGRCLERLKWTDEVLVIDSGSSDATLAICKEFANVRVVHREFDSFARQCNYGLSLLKSEWVLSLDADYLLPEGTPELLSERVRFDEAAGVSIRFRYAIFGRRLRGSLYPARTVLYRRTLACYEDDGHAHRVRINGPVEQLTDVWIDHDDRKPFSRWLQSQQSYARQEAAKLADTQGVTGRADRLRLMIWPAPVLVFFYTYFFKGCIFDGWAGLYYTFQRVYAELLLSLELLDRRLRK